MLFQILPEFFLRLKFYAIGPGRQELVPEPLPIIRFAAAHRPTYQNLG